MKRTGMRLTAVAAVTALLLGGCGEQPYSLTEDEEGMIVDYSAHAVENLIRASLTVLQM